MRVLLRLLTWTLIVAASSIGLARATAIRWWRVPSDDPWLGVSVTPSIEPGDWVLLWRLTRPVDGDLVLCPEPKAPERIVVGRVFGSGNDELLFANGTITRNSQPLRTERGCGQFEVSHPRTNELIRQNCSIEDLDGRLHMRGGTADGSSSPQTPKKVVVEPGQFFLVSDNRQFPFDSRDFGPVPSASCRETVVFRLWSRNGYFDQERRFEVIH